MNVRIKLNGEKLPAGSLKPAKAPDQPARERLAWYDSSMDLKRGLEVTEHSIDVLLPDLPELPTPRER